MWLFDLYITCMGLNVGSVDFKQLEELLCFVFCLWYVDFVNFFDSECLCFFVLLCVDNDLKDYVLL